MINPQPVGERRSPYSSGSAQNYSNIPRPASQLPGALSPKKPRRWKRVVGLLVVTAVMASGTYIYAQYQSFKNNVLLQHEGESSAILGYDPTDENSRLDPAAFKKIGDGRFNIVVVGIGGENHAGGNLTDSIQVVSVDTINKKVGITSVPRDLYVSIPGYGRSKINATYNVGEQRKAGNGAVLLREVLGNVLGVKISNFALVDFTGMKEIVDELGGIDINVPEAIYDPSYPDDQGIGYKPFSVRAGQQTMNGETALKYSRTRKSDSDFKRSERQQHVIQAIKDKALSLGVLTNPVKITNLIQTLGKHFKTDMQVEQIRALLGIYKEIPSESSKGFVLDTSSALGLLTSVTDPVAGYIAYPLAGYDKFENVQQWFIKNNPDPLVAREQTTISVANGGKATEKQMRDLVELLKSYGYNASLSTGTVPKNKYTATALFRSKTGKDKPFSNNYLSSQFNAQPQDDTPLASTSDFELIYFPPSSSTKK